MRREDPSGIAYAAMSVIMEARSPTFASFNLPASDHGAHGRTRTGTAFLPRDFKSPVSTNSTTRACDWIRLQLSR